MAEEQPAVIKIQDFEKISLWTATPGVEGKRAKLSFGIRDGNPRFTVFTNDPSDRAQKGVITAAMNIETLYIFLGMFEKVIKSKDEVKLKIDCYTSRWENNQRTGDRIKQSEIWFGKDAEGLVWLLLLAEGRPTIKFIIRMSDWHNIYNPSGQQVSEAEASVLEASAKLAILRNVYDRMTTDAILTPNARFSNTPPADKPADTPADKPKDSGFGDDLPF